MKTQTCILTFGVLVLLYIVVTTEDEYHEVKDERKIHFNSTVSVKYFDKRDSPEEYVSYDTLRLKK